MNPYTAGLGIVSVMIIFGIIISGTFTNLDKKYSTDSNVIIPTLDELMVQIDVNATASVDNAFIDTNVSPGIKKTAHYIAKGIIYGIYVDIAIGQAINEYMPGTYEWVINNMYLVIAGLILLIYPDIISLIIWCIFGLILIIKERFFDKPDKKPKNTWRDYKSPPVEIKKDSIFKKLFGKRD